MPPEPEGEIRNPLGAVMVSGDDDILVPYKIDVIVEELVLTGTIPNASEVVIGETVGIVPEGIILT